MRVPFFPLARLHADRREALAGAMREVLDSGWFVLGLWICLSIAARLLVISMLRGFRAATGLDRPVN